MTLFPPRQRDGETDLEWAKRVHAYVERERHELEIIVPIAMVLWFLVLLAVWICSLAAM